ncbi:MAG TPA: ECF-type sigma factor [Albitalea sp.]|uniref:ECF-type sigma factor n=1 Tax=Piscinibacter sp. TaxID=1903157 RepID=UPI002ED2A7EB
MSDEKVDRQMEERLTELLSRTKAGDRAARDALFALAYRELRRLAHARLAGGGRNTVLDTTSLVHESYLRLVQADELTIEDRRAFFGYASRVMRSVIVDSARARVAERRGGNAPKLSLSTDLGDGLAQDEDNIVQVHEALEELEKADPRAARMVEMRYFGGYSDKEIAETLDVTERTVQRDWEKARMLLRVMLNPA